MSRPKRHRPGALQNRRGAARTQRQLHVRFHLPLKQVQGADKSWGIAWEFDTWGNRLTQTPAGLATSKVGTQTLGYTSTTNRNMASVFRYDAVGNQTNDGTHNYTFNSENQITQMDGGTAVYDYDGDGRRMKKTVGTETTYYFYAVGALVSDSPRPTPAPPGPHLPTGPPIRLPTSSARPSSSWPHPVWSSKTTGHYPTARNGVSAAGSANEQKFTSYQRDGESGLDYAIHRFDATTRGVFMSADRGPISLALPQSLNRTFMPWLIRLTIRTRMEWSPSRTTLLPTTRMRLLSIG